MHVVGDKLPPSPSDSTSNHFSSPASQQPRYAWHPAPEQRSWPTMRPACVPDTWLAHLSIWQRASRTQQLRPDTKMYRLLARACRAAGADDELADLLASAEREGVPMMALQEADDDGVGPADTSSDDDDDEVAEELATTALGWENM